MSPQISEVRAGGTGATGGRRRTLLPGALILIISALAWYPRFQGPLDLRWDSSVYYVLGTSLAQGAGYRLLNEPGQIVGIQYPPLLPAIIAAHQLILGTDDPFVVAHWLKLSWFLLSVVTVWGVFIITRQFTTAMGAFCAAVLSVFSLPFYLHANQASAELPFTATTVAFLLFYLRPWTVRNELACMVCGAAGFFLRTAGSALFAASIADALARRQFFRAAARTLLAGGCVAAWQAHIWRAEKPAAYSYQAADYLYSNTSYARNMSYIDPYRPELGRATAAQIGLRIGAQLAAMPEHVGEVVTTHRGFWEVQRFSINRIAGAQIVSESAISAVLYSFGLIALAGILILFQRGERLMPFYALATMIIVAITPWPGQHGRYLLPVLPVFFLGMIVSLRWVWTVCSTGRTHIKAACRAITAGIILFLYADEFLTFYQAHTHFFKKAYLPTITGQTVYYRQLCYGAELIAMDEAITYVAERADRSDIIVASMPHWVYLRTRLQAVMPPLEADVHTAAALLESVPARFIINENRSFFTHAYVRNVMTAYPNKWRLVYVAPSDDVRVFERISD